MFPTVRSS